VNLNNLSKLKHQKLLAINFGGIGDEILFLPTLKTLRQHLPEAHLTLLLEPRSSSIKELTPLIDEVISFDIKKQPRTISDLLALVGLLRSGNYQTVISSGSSPLVAMLLFLSGVPKRIGYDSGYLSRKLLTQAVRLNQNQYAAQMYHDLVQGLGLPACNALPELSVPKTSLAAVQAFLKQSPTQADNTTLTRILIHPGTSSLAIQKGIIKTWKANHWAALIESLCSHADIEVILSGGPDDTATVSDIRKSLASRNVAGHLRSAFGVTKNLGDLAALIQLSDLLVCVDSAPMHVAVGIRKPLVALFGPTQSKRLLPPNLLFKPLSDQGDLASFRNVAPRLQDREDSGIELAPSAVYQAVLDHLAQMRVQARN